MSSPTESEDKQSTQACLLTLGVLAAVVVPLFFLWRHLNPAPADAVPAPGTPRELTSETVTIAPGDSWSAAFTVGGRGTSSSETVHFKVHCLDGLVEMSLGNATKQLVKSHEFTIYGSVAHGQKCWVYNRDRSAPATVKINVTAE